MNSLILLQTEGKKPIFECIQNRVEEKLKLSHWFKIIILWILTVGSLTSRSFEQRSVLWTICIVSLRGMDYFRDFPVNHSTSTNPTIMKNHKMIELNVQRKRNGFKIKYYSKTNKKGKPNYSIFKNFQLLRMNRGKKTFHHFRYQYIQILFLRIIYIFCNVLKITTQF